MTNFKLATCCMIDKDFGYKSTTKTAFLKNKDYKKLVSIWTHNIHKTREAFNYLLHQAEVYHYFRVSSSIFPLSTLPEVHQYFLDWFESDGKKITNNIGEYVLENDKNFRAVVHPDQFVVVNSKNENVVQNSIRELEITYLFMENLKLPYNINIHLSGKDSEAKNRSKANHKRLPSHLAKVISYENDEKSSCIADILEVCEEVGALPCFDIHHEAVFHTFYDKEYKLQTLDENNIARIESLWQRTNLPPTFHVSNRLEKNSIKGKACAHSDFLYEKENEALLPLLKKGWHCEIEAKAKFPAVQLFYENFCKHI
jgi:UV DNA damage endonuclease